LAVGAHTIWLTKFFMLITFPLAFPISKILDKILGAEIGTVYNKKRLIELLRVTRDKNDLEKEEVDIVTGALAYKEKTVKSCMTALADVYMLNIKTTLDFETISEIREQGFSRHTFRHTNTELHFSLIVFS
jgi:metal transporter CNNM